nr:aminotransferase class I/II-fold pyridoxal phosphate-dependent enzyme [Mycobacterium leprae]
MPASWRWFRHTILIDIDKAYVEYIRYSLPQDSPELVRVNSDIVVLKAFSSSMGLRVGYAISYSDTITVLDKVYVPFTVSNVAQDATIVALKVNEELLASTDSLVRYHTRVNVALCDAGFALSPAQTNFVWVPLGITH